MIVNHPVISFTSDTIFAGVDYGSKLAGTTVVAIWDGKSLQIVQSKKKQDADAFLQAQIRQYQVSWIGLDAPLSLPGVYTQPTQYQDYFYRTGDRLLQAMSPMFLGGLTARAMQLARTLAAEGKYVIEVYPAALAKHFDLQALDYKNAATSIPKVLEKLIQLFTWLPNSLELENWHQVDALLALCSTSRYLHQDYLVFGDDREGVIIV
ncbi:MAG: DUF429 domain-containing protein [Saprospiraceae bacterium]|nr:DUF429 domain-containing protein [Saprospiraceae bacterium]